MIIRKILLSKAIKKETLKSIYGTFYDPPGKLHNRKGKNNHFLRFNIFGQYRHFSYCSLHC